jgi:hypothetical protein
LGGKVQVIAFDATKDAIENLRKGMVSLVIAQNRTIWAIWRRRSLWQMRAA